VVEVVVELVVGCVVEVVVELVVGCVVEVVVAEVPLDITRLTLVLTGTSPWAAGLCDSTVLAG
jgi:hypothetical protein